MGQQSGQYELAIAKAQMRAAKERQASANSLGDQIQANRAELTGRMLGAGLGIALVSVLVFAGSKFALLANSVAAVFAVGMTALIVSRRRRVAMARQAQYEATLRNRPEADPVAGEENR